jgi:DNA-binding XRE family transcriptional regulator
MYCQALVRWCKKGLSYESFASACNVSEQTLYDWEKAHPEFLEAKKIGYPHCRAFWERAGIAGKIPAGTWIFNMKNRFGWRDKSPEESAESAEVIAKAMIAYANTL